MWLQRDFNSDFVAIKDLNLILIKVTKSLRFQLTMLL